MTQLTDEILVEIGRRIATARTARGWTQTRLAEACGVDRKTVTSYERGIRWPSLPAFLRLCAALEIVPGDVLSHADLIWPLSAVEREAVRTLREIGEERAPLALALLRAMVSGDREPEKSG